MISRAIERIKQAGDNMIVAHEEAITLLQHLVLLYGADDGPGPASSEMALWLLASGDHLDVWAEPDARVLTTKEALMAEQAKVFRLNRSVDPMRSIVRTFEILRKPPRTGPLSDSATYSALQLDAFNEPFEDFFQSKLLLLYMLSISWGGDLGSVRGLPALDPQALATKPATTSLASFLLSQAATRGDLRVEIRKRMRPDGIVPHAPTALLHQPLVQISDQMIMAASPWMLRAQRVWFSS